MAKKRKSGNGTWARQHLYLALHVYLSVPMVALVAILTLCIHNYDLAYQVGLSWYYRFSPLVLFFMLCKIGITGNLKQRKRTIDKSVPGFIVPLFWGQIYAAYQIEQLLHTIFSPIRVRFIGSGGTEYFFTLALLLSWPFILIYWLLHYVLLIAAVAVGMWVLAGAPKL